MATKFDSIHWIPGDTVYQFDQLNGKIATRKVQILTQKRFIDNSSDLDFVVSLVGKPGYYNSDGSSLSGSDFPIEDTIQAVRDAIEVES